MRENLAVTESALRLIMHAEHDIATTAVVASTQEGRIHTTSFGVVNDPLEWRRELALLRIVSTIEAYIDAVSIARIAAIIPSSNKTIARLLADFEVNSGKTWQDRHETFANYHGFSLKSQPGWNEVSAGIEVRNCLAHGLGNLTAQQRAKSNLGSVVKAIGVTVGGNRMHLHAQTIPKFAQGCRIFINGVDHVVGSAVPRAIQ